MEVTADFLQKITLISKSISLSIAPDNMKETISEVRSKIAELKLADLKRVWKAVFYGTPLWDIQQCGIPINISTSKHWLSR